MKPEKIKKDININISKEQIINTEKIPNIDLYVDQVIKLIENYFVESSTNDPEIITKAMINNYTKKNILPIPISKKYNKELIEKIIMLCNMKGILSINDIGLILNSQALNEDLEKMYVYFTKIQEEEINKTNELIKEYKFTDNKPATELILKMIIDVNVKKQLIEQLIKTL